MRRAVSLLLILAMALSLCSCTLSKEEKAQVENADKLIESFGEVSLGKKTEMDEMRKAVKDLGDNRKHLKNEEKYEELVSNYNSLVKTEAEKIDSEILGLKTVTKDNILNVENAREHYNNSNPNVKALVKNKALLEEAVKKAGEVKKSQRNEAKKLLKTFRVKHDEVKDVTYYFPKCRPQYINTRTYCLPYLAKSDLGYTLFLEVNYYGDDWIFFKNLNYVADDERYTQSLDYFRIEHDVVDGGVCETDDIVLSEENAKKLLTVANAKKAIVRFSGDEYCYDLKLNDTDKKAMRDMINAYLILKD